MKRELPLGILTSTASQFKELIEEVRKNNAVSEKQRRRWTPLPVSSAPPNFWRLPERNPALDAAYQEELRRRNEGITVSSNKLPVFSKKDDILHAIENNPVVVIAGETGCGKTTQIPQFILDHYIENGKGSLCRVMCCQPRRLSAVGVAERVAKERRELCGEKCSTGYQIRLDSRPPRNSGCILFCTTGILQNLVVRNKKLSFCSHIIIDEVHERRIEVDFIITVMRDLIRLNKNSNVHLILMSASINPESFAEYFDNCPIVKIPGFTYPVKKYMLQDIFEFTGFQPTVTSKKQLKKSKAVSEEFIESIRDKYSPHTIDRLQRWDEAVDCNLVVSLLKYICRQEDKGAILIFFTGWEEIHHLRTHILKDDMFNNSSYRILVLHSRIPIHNQVEIFNPPPKGTRKIIISTNIAEASLTIDDVTHVIDCGMVKVSKFNVKNTVESLDTCWISKASARQRRGRAGRTRPGKCYHLFTSHRESLLEEFQAPEMVHSSLEAISLQVKLFDLYDIETFYSNVMDKPKPKAIELSIKLLRTLHCLDNNEALTPLGSVVAQLPLNPYLGKMIVFGAIFSCLSPILTIVAVLDYNDPFSMPQEGRTFAKLAKQRLADNTMSDHIMFVRAFDEWDESRNKEQYCKENFIMNNTMVMISKLRNYYCNYLHRLGFIRTNKPRIHFSNKNSGKTAVIKAIVCAGLYPNIAVGDTTSDNTKYYTRELRVHPHSWSISNISPEFTGRWLVYYKRIKTQKLQLHYVSAVRPILLYLFSGELEKTTVNGEEATIDGWIKLCFRSSESQQLLGEIRETFLAILNKVIVGRNAIDWYSEKPEVEFIRAIVEHICKKRIQDTSVKTFY